MQDVFSDVEIGILNTFRCVSGYKDNPYYYSSSSSNNNNNNNNNNNTDRIAFPTPECLCFK
jgi:hypothetical protein